MRYPIVIGMIAAVFCSVATAQSAGSHAEDKAVNPKSAPIEEIYILRSLRVARSTTPGAFCDAAKIGFTAQVEDRYTFKAVATRAGDGKVIDARRRNAGTLQACFDSVPGVADSNFYGEGRIAGVNASGKGKCTLIAADFPEPGITSFRCFLVLANLSPPYFAGVLTTNTIKSREPLGERSDPPGYVQPSIATIRLWRKR